MGGEEELGEVNVPSLRVDRGQEEFRICSGQRPWALKTHMNRLGACVWLDDG